MSFTPRARRVIVLGPAGLLALCLLYVALWRPSAALEGPEPDDGYARASGVVHVHTSHSDGSGTPEEVVAAARASGAAFVVITDHNNLDAKAFEGYHDGVLTLVGTEVSTTRGHVVGIGTREPAYRFSGDAGDALSDIRELGGAAFAAHPLSPRADFRFSGWDLPGPWGIEVWNGDSQWREAGAWRLARTVGLSAVNSRYALLGALTGPATTLARWDALLAERDVPGLAGTDAHARLEIMSRRSLRVPSYAAMFGVMQNHVLLEAPLTGRFDDDARSVVEALRRGRSYVGVDGLAPAAGFLFVAEKSGQRWSMGDTAPAGPGLRLRAGGKLPRGTSLQLLRDGRPVSRADGSLVASDVVAGVYRIEARLPGWDAPFILSNPIYVFAAEAAETRRRRAAWPDEPAAPAAAQILDAFEGQTVFAAGCDPSSAIEQPIVDPKAGADGKGAGRLRFRLGQPAPGKPDVYCALVDWTHRDLSGRKGLVFSVRGDGVYRTWVQVRDANPASKDEGTEWWFASVKTTESWRRVAIPFASLRSINPKSDGRLDLDKLRAIVFVVDMGAARPGGSGTIWLDDLGVY